MIVTVYIITVTFISKGFIPNIMRSIRSTSIFFGIVSTFTVFSIVFSERIRLSLRIFYMEWWSIVATLMLALTLDVIILLHDVLGQADRLNASYKVHRFLRKKLYQMEKQT